MARVVSIHSFRGGTGKSNLTANLMALIAQAGYRVGVIDTDIQSPGIHVLFGLDESKMDRALNDYLWGKYPIEHVAYDVSPMMHVGKGELTVISGGVYLIPSSLRAGEIARVLREGYDVGVLNDGLRSLITRLNLDYLLIDTHPGLNEETLLSLAISDTLIVIIRPDQQDYQGTGVTIEIARKLNVPRMFMVINKVLPSFDFDVMRLTVEKTYHVPVAGVLPLSEDMVRLGSSGVFALIYPDHPVTQILKAIANHVMAE